MFTGIIEGTGIVRGFEAPDLILQLPFACPPVGSSVAVNGVCLTVKKRAGRTMTTQVMEETLCRTNLGALTEGDGVNVERAMTAGQRLDGHIVQGHVDTTATLLGIEERPHSHLLWLKAPKSAAPCLVEKGSVTLDGISLTLVNAQASGRFSVSIIPHTWEITNLHTRQPGDRLNLELDILAKLLKRLAEPYLKRLGK